MFDLREDYFIYVLYFLSFLSDNLFDKKPNCGFLRVAFCAIVRMKNFYIMIFEINCKTFSKLRISFLLVAILSYVRSFQMLVMYLLILVFLKLNYFSPLWLIYLSHSEVLNALSICLLSFRCCFL